jgi:hypothetical protein
VADRNTRRSISDGRGSFSTGGGCGTAEIMRRAGVSKPCVWCWRGVVHIEGIAGLATDGQSGRHQRPARCNASVARMGCKPHRVRQFKLSGIRGSPPSCVTSLASRRSIPRNRGRRRTATSAYLHTVTDASIQRSGSALRGSRNAAGRNPAIVSRPTRSAASECNQYGKAGRA